MSGTDRKASQALQSIASVVDYMLKDAAGQELGFCIFVFPAESDSRASYIGNCAREETAEAIQKCLDHWRDGMPDIAAHEVQS